MKKILIIITILIFTGCSGLYKVSDEELKKYDGNKGIKTEYDENKGVKTEYDDFNKPLLFHLLFSDMIAF